MRPNILPAFVLCAVLLIETKAQEQSFSGYNAFGSGDETNYDNEGSGSIESGVEKVVDTMKKLNKSKSDAEFSKNLKNGARQVMHSIVEKLVTHTGEKISNNVEKAFADQSHKRTETGTNESVLAKNENSDDKTAVGDAGNDTRKANVDQFNVESKTDTSNAENDSKTAEPVPGAGNQKSALPTEKNALNVIGENETSSYSQPGSDNPGEEHIDSGNKQSDSAPQNEAQPKEDKVTGDHSGSYTSTYGYTKPLAEAELNTPTDNDNNNNDNNVADIKENKSNQVKTGTSSNQISEENQEIRDANTAGMTDKQTDSLNGLSINVETPIATDTKMFVKSEKNTDTAKSVASNEQKLISQEKTVDRTTGFTGSSQGTLSQRNGRRSKKRYRLHSHAHNTHKTSKFRNISNKNSHSRYTNVNKYLIKRNRNKNGIQAEKQDVTERYPYQGPVSNEMESVLNVDSMRQSTYSKSKYGHKKHDTSLVSRSRTDNNNNEIDEGSSEGASGDSTGILKSQRLKLRDKKHRYSHRNSKKRSRKLSTRRLFGDQTLKSSNKNAAYQQTPYAANRSLPTKSAKFVKGSKKFTFFSMNRAVPLHNQTAENEAGNGHVITPVAANTNQLDFDMEANQQEEPMPVPVVLIKPTMPQSTGFMPMVTLPMTTTRPTIPASSSNPPSNNEANPTTDDDENSENITIIAQPEGTVSPSQELYPPSQEPYPPDTALTEEVKSLESRMTVLEAAVAEVIEWIRNHSPNQVETSPSTAQVTIRPALPYPRPTSGTETQEEPTRINAAHGPRLLKQIFIPLPPPDSEAETEIENGQPVAGLPFPLNFVVAKLLAKMAKSRESHRFTTKHPHTPVPDIDIPAIEHDINRLEMELNSVPNRLLHHHHRHPRLHDLDSNEEPRNPLLGQLVNSEPEKDSPVCSASCKNGGLCIDDNTCKCPPFYNGAACESFDVGSFLNSRRASESPSPSDSSHQLVMSQFRPGIRREMKERKRRRGLVRVLNNLLQNLANENSVSSMRKDEIPSQREFESQGYEEIEEPQITEEVYR